jgi:hypothetical protein
MPTGVAMFKSRLNQMENRLQELIEGGATRLFPASYKQNDLASQFMEVMSSSIQQAPDGALYCPNLFIIEANPAQADALIADRVIVDGIYQILYAELEKNEIHFAYPLTIRVIGNPSAPYDEFNVSAQVNQAGLTRTSAMQSAASNQAESTNLPANAFLIVDGVRVFPITGNLMNIGRRSDNHLVINDPRVSRVHAQLRFVRGNFIIFDLNSSGGTWVNGERIHQRGLRPGDVISLSGVPLVFGHENQEADETQQLETRA